MNVRVNLDDYLSWRKHLEQPSDDPNVPIFKRFDEYNFDTDRKFQQGLPSIIGQLIKDGKSTLDKAALQKEMTKAKAFYYARYVFVCRYTLQGRLSIDPLSKTYSSLILRINIF